MKKFLSAVLAFLVFNTCCYADVLIPEFLTTPITNYTGEYDIRLTFDNSEEIVALLKELEMPEEVSNYVDPEMLLRTLLSGESAMHVQVDMSEDYSKMQMGLTEDASRLIQVNPNLQMDIDTKTGMWVDMDLSDETSPVYDIICIQPFQNKYLKIEGAKLYEEAGMPLTAIYNKETIDTLQSEAMKIFMANSTMQEIDNSNYIFTMDNDGFITYMSEVIRIALETVDLPDTADFELPDLDGIKILGKEGMTAEVKLSMGKVQTVNLEADISLDLAALCETLTGEPWAYESAKSIDFTLSMQYDVSKIGKTKVDFPTLTEENSFTLDLEPMNPAYGDSEESIRPPYPGYYIYETSDNLPVIDDEIYVPLRQTIASAYDDQAVIGYDNRNITLTSEYFNGYTEIKFLVGADVAYVDGVEKAITSAIILDNKTYVPASFFVDLFGWALGSAQYDMQYKDYSYAFYTDPTMYE